jgi:hypothetical protein
VVTIFNLTKEIKNYYNSNNKEKTLTELAKKTFYNLIDNGLDVQDVDPLMIRILRFYNDFRFKNYLFMKSNRSIRCCIYGVNNEILLSLNKVNRWNR